MDQRVEAFVTNVLSLFGGDAESICAGTLRYLAVCEKQYRDAEPDVQRKELAAQMCRTLCRIREC